jgi:hypothetical protein
MFVSRNQIRIRIIKNDTHLIVQVKQLRRPKDLSMTNDTPLIVLMKESQNDSAASGNHFDFRF